MEAELELIRRIAAQTAVRPGVRVGIGDDMAVLAGDPPLLAAVDMLVEGVHFLPGRTPLADVGHKALAVNLSDVAAMGGEPVCALVGLGLPARGGPDAAGVGELYAGMEALAARTGTTIAGGDVTAAPGLVLSVSVIARMPTGVAPLLRSGGRPGDLVCVTGA
ncbi:MAG: thiamine-phosphate kinase, partial [Thermoleophilia bacterium]|nr:thiamine-phosphate kinase [Thermoleophilia bacterium]